MVRLIALAVLVLWPSIASAQAPPNVAPGQPLYFDMVTVAPLATVQGYVYRHYDDGAAAGSVIAGVTCSASIVAIPPAPSTYACAFPFPAFTPGPHTVQLTAADPSAESAKSAVLSFTFVVVVVTPANLRLTKGAGE